MGRAAERTPHAQQRAALPTAATDCRRWVGLVSVPPHAALPDGAAVAVPAAIQRVGPALEQELAQAMPARPNSAHWNYPRMNGRATVVLSGRQKPAKPKE